MTTPDAEVDNERRASWFKRADPAYDALPSAPIAVNELTINGQVWDRWAQSARDAALGSSRVSGLVAGIVAALLALPGLILLPGASKSVVICAVPLASWGCWRIVRDTVLRRTFSEAAQDMRTQMVPTLFESVTDLELMRIARTGAGPVIGDSKIARVEQRTGDAVIIVAEYDLRLLNEYFTRGSA